jgi:hypothetical protein
MTHYNGYDFEPITTPVLWDGQLICNGWFIYCDGQEVTVAYPDEDIEEVIDSLY